MSVRRVLIHCDSFKVEASRVSMAMRVLQCWYGPDARGKGGAMCIHIHICAGIQTQEQLMSLELAFE